MYDRCERATGRTTGEEDDVRIATPSAFGGRGSAFCFARHFGHFFLCGFFSGLFHRGWFLGVVSASYQQHTKYK
jgi:hypothetical protein